MFTTALFDCFCLTEHDNAGRGLGRHKTEDYLLELEAYHTGGMSGY
jgi:hypothetical protein